MLNFRNVVIAVVAGFGLLGAALWVVSIRGEGRSAPQIQTSLSSPSAPSAADTVASPPSAVEPLQAAQSVPVTPVRVAGSGQNPARVQSSALASIETPALTAAMSTEPPQSAAAESPMPYVAQAAPLQAQPRTAEASATLGPSNAVRSCFGGAFSSAEPVGVARARGSFRVDGSLVQETATLFDGARIQSGNAPVVLAFRGGTQFRLAANSDVILSADHVLLQAGIADTVNANGCEIHARGLRIIPLFPTTGGRVQMAEGIVTVAAATGSFRVLNAKSDLVANVDETAAISFTTAGLNEQIPFVRGCLARNEGRLVLTDDLTTLLAEVVVPARDEVMRSRLDDEVGRRVEVIGYAKAAAARRPILIEVSGVQRVGNCGQGILAKLWPWWTLGITGASAGLVVCGNNCFPDPPISR